MAETADSIAELVAYLGLAIDESSWNEGLELLEKAKKGVEEVSEKKSEAHKKEKKEHEELKDVLEEGLETFFGYEGVKSITEMVEHTMEATIAAKHLGERLGLTTETVQSLGYAADVTGASSATMTSALQRLSFNLQQSGQHGDHFKETLRGMGINTTELSKTIKGGGEGGGGGLDAALGEIAEKFKEMPDGPKKVALAMQLFGRNAGPQLIPLLNEGKEGIKELREEAERLGVTTSEENVEKAEMLERSQKRLQARWGAMKDALVFALIPALNFLTNAMSKVVDFLREHEDVTMAILAGIAAAILYIGYTAMLTHAELLMSFGAVIGPIMLAVYAVQALVDVFEHGFQPVKVILMTLALLVLGFLSPWYAIGAAVAAAAIIIYKHWSEIKDFFVNLWNEVVDTFENASTAIKVAIFVAFLPISMIILVIKELIEHFDTLIEKAKEFKHWGSDLIDLIPGVGVARSVYGLATGDGLGALKHAIPGVTLGQDIYRTAAGSDDDEKSASDSDEQKVAITQHNSVTINTGASKEDVQKALDDHFDKNMQQAHHELKRGG